MRLDRQEQRIALRAVLLLGATGAAAAVSSSALADQAPAQPPSDPQKWSPYSSIEGSAGSGMVAGKLDFFVPLFQNVDSLVFLNLGVGTETKAHTLFNAGLGYRTKIDADWIVGAYVNHDDTQLQDNNTFSQTALGAELMSAEWDVRLNGYIADNEAKPVPGAFGLFINGTTIGILQGQDVGYTGFDGEVGYRVWSDDTTDVRVFIGGFHFSHGNTTNASMGQGFDFGYRDLTGPKARAEATVYDLDVLGNQSRVTLEGEIAHDDVRGTTGFVGATLRVALGNFSGGGGAQALDELDRRMVDPERRNDTVTTRAQMTKPEPVIIYGPGVKSQPTNTLLYVDNTLGQGTYANPTTFADAAGRPTTNAFIVLTSKQGPITGGATLQPGQTVVAGGQSFTVEGEFSHAKFTHLFDPSTNVTVVPATPGGNVITLASNTSLYGFTIKGNFGDAVYGKNVDHVSISHVTIDGTGGGQSGIVIDHTVSGEEIVNIDHVAISNVAEDGIRLSSVIADGGSSTETFTLDNISAANIGGVGIHIDAYETNGSKVASNISLSNVAATGASMVGIDIFSGAYGVGSTINQTVAVSNATISGARLIGLYVDAFAGAGSTITQNVIINGATVSNSTNGYIGDGIALSAEAFGAGATVAQTATITNANIPNVYGQALYITATAENGAHVVQSATISNSSGTYSYRGLSIGAAALDKNGTTTPTTVDQYVSVTGSNFSHNHVGVIAFNRTAPFSTTYLSMAADRQTISISNTTIDNNATGVLLENEAFFGASANQYASFNGVQIEHNAADGVTLYTYAAALGFAKQHVTFDNAAGYNEISYNIHNGIFVSAAASSGGAVDQHLYVYHSHVDHNGGDGIYVVTQNGGYTYKNGQLYYSHIQQNLIFAYGSVSRNGGNGVFISNTVNYVAQTDQIIQLYKETVDHNAANGFFETSTMKTYRGYGFAGNTVLHSNVYLYSSDFSYNGGSGINIQSHLNSPTTYVPAHPAYSYLEQHITAGGVTANHNTLVGFENTAYDKGVFGLNIQYVTLSGSQFTYNGQNGAQFIAHQFYGPGPFGAAEQTVTLQGSQFNHNSFDGLYASAYAGGNQGRAEQHFTVTGSYFDNNGASGIDLKRFAENGVYVSGLPCTAVQGLSGGCAFVRTTFDMTGGGASQNGTYGIFVENYANNFGAIYATTAQRKFAQHVTGYIYPGPTVLLNGVTADGNGSFALFSGTLSTNHSYVYSYLAAIDSKFDHNKYGVYVVNFSYSNSSIVERNLFYALKGTPSISYNGTGLFIRDRAGTGGSVTSTNYIIGVLMSHSARWGIALGAESYGPASQVTQSNIIANTRLYSNGKDGLDIGSYFSGASQREKLYGNIFNSNSRYAIYAVVDGAYQYVAYQSYGNVLNGGATKFISRNGGTRVIK